MATIESSQPRRKGATYGKPTRKRLLNYDYDDVFAVPQRSPDPIHNREDVAHNQAQEFREKQTLADVSRAATTQARVRQKEGSVSRETKAARRHPTTVVSGKSTSTKESHVQTYPTKARFQASAAKPSVNVFDVPSSDDEMETPKATLKRTIPDDRPFRSSTSSTGGSEAKELSVYDFHDSSDANERELRSNSSTPRKKRRVIDSSRESPVGLDDASLQKHIALQAVKERSPKPNSPAPLPERKKLPKICRSPDTTSARTGRLKAPPTKHQGRQASKSLPPEQRMEKCSEIKREADPAKRKQTSPKGAPKGKTLKAKEISAPGALQNMISDNQNHPQLPSSKSRVIAQSQKLIEATQSRKLAPNSAALIGREQGLKTPPRVTFAAAPQARLWNKLVAEGISTERVTKRQNVVEMDLSEDGSTTGSESGARQVNLGKKPRRRIIDSLAKGPDVLLARKSEVDDDGAVAEPSSSPAQSSLTHSQTTNDVISQTDSQVSVVASGTTSASAVPNGPLAGPRVGPKITYAQQRSFLTENMREESNIFDAPLEVESGGYGQGGRRYGRGGNTTAKIVPSLDLEQDAFDEANAGAIRSIHELREAGSNKRFLDEMEAFFEDIEDRSGTLSRKRSALLELGSKLAEKAFARRFVDNNLHQRLFVRLGSEQDIIVGTVLASSIIFTLNDIIATRSATTLHEEGAVQMLVMLLESDRDITSIAKQRRTNMSKVAQSLVSDFRIVVKASPIWEAEDLGQVSPRIIALKALELLVRKLREEGTTELNFPKETAGKVVQVLSPFSKWTSQAEPTATESVTLELALSVLESYAIRMDSRGDGFAADTDSLDVLTELLPSILRWTEANFRQMILLVLHLNLSITNNNAVISDALARPELLRSLVYMVQSKFSLLSDDLDEESRLYELDGLVLALGLLINFAELSNTARVLLLKDDNSGLLGILLRIFLDRSGKAAEADSMEETQSNVAFGYLSVLLGTLSQSRDVREFLRSGLPGGTLRALVDAVDEFLQHHKKVDDQLNAEGEVGVGEGFTQRLQMVVDRLKVSEREG